MNKCICKKPNPVPEAIDKYVDLGLRKKPLGIQIPTCQNCGKVIICVKEL